MPKEPAQNQARGANQNVPKGTPRGAAAAASTPKSRSRKAKGPKPVLTVNAPKPPQTKPASNTPKSQVKQTNQPASQSEKFESAIQTAKMIAKNQSHPKNKDVSDSSLPFCVRVFFTFLLVIFALLVKLLFDCDSITPYMR